jgi:hypothetical protein
VSRQTAHDGSPSAAKQITRICTAVSLPDLGCPMQVSRLLRLAELLPVGQDALGPGTNGNVNPFKLAQRLVPRRSQSSCWRCAQISQIGASWR